VLVSTLADRRRGPGEAATHCTLRPATNSQTRFTAPDLERRASIHMLQDTFYTCCFLPDLWHLEGLADDPPECKA